MIISRKLIQSKKKVIPLDFQASISQAIAPERLIYSIHLIVIFQDQR